MISRRRFVSMMVASAAGFLLGNPGTTIPARYPHFFFAQIRYRGGDWDPNSQFVEPIVEELELRTSIESQKERRVVTLSDPELFYSPFLYMAGKHEFEPFGPADRERLRRFLSFGGFLLAEDTMGARGSGFDQAFRREMREVLPRYELKRLPPDHSVYQSFYMISSAGGRQRIHPLLEGITIDTWTPVIYCQNDLAGAWARDRFGRWVNECVPGGEQQRSAAFKTGINIIVYSLTSDYKKDVVHHPFIKRRQNQ